MLAAASAVRWQRNENDSRKWRKDSAMATVITEGGRSVDTADYIEGDTIGTLAQGIAGTVYDLQETAIAGQTQLPPARQFSLKVGGHVLHPDTATGEVALHDGNVIELIEVTDQQWGSPLEPAGVIRVEVPTGTVEDLIDWVGDDHERAEAALATEALQEHPRSTLIEHLCSHFDLADPTDDDAHQDD